MSCRELIDSLRKAAGDRNRKIWEEAETEAEQIRQEAGCRCETLRAEAAGKQAAAARQATAAILSQAQNKARFLKLSAQQEISARLYKAALSRLPDLRNRSYESVFGKLVRELPVLEWKTVRVRPDDLLLARKYFPGALIEADASISGGLEASTPEEAIRVINTFEKRLERAWVGIEPALVRDLWCEVTDETPLPTAGSGISGRIPAVEDQGQEIAAGQGLETADL